MPRAETNGRWGELAIIVLYAVLLTAGILRHEVWLDEAQAWLMARDATSLAQLQEFMRWERHPEGWYWLLFAVSRLARSPLAMQVVHGIVALAAVGVFVWHAPFSRTQKLLFALGYYPLFEYGIIARNYSWGVLFGFLGCVALSRHRRMAAVAFLPLMAMVLGHFYSCMVALVLGAALLLNEATEAIGRRRWTSSLTVAAVGNALLVGWSLWTLARIMPPPDMTFNRPPVLAFYPGRVLSALCIPWRGLVPVPCVTAGRAFWGTNVLGLEALPQRLVGALAGTFLLLGLGGCFVRKCTSLVVFGGGVLGLMSFAYVKGLYTSLGTVRQHGYAFLLLLLAFWLREVLPQTDLLRAVSSYVPERLSAAWQSLEQRLFAGTRLLTVILAINAGCGLHAWAMDMVLPFCNTRSVAALLKPRLDRQTLVVGDKDLWTCAMAAHLDTGIYYPKGKRRGTFLVWNRDREAPVALPELVQDTNAAIERGLKVFLVLSYALDPDALGSAGARFRVHLLQSCPTPIIGQRLWVYEATPAVDDDSSPGGTPGAPPAG